MDVKTGEFMSYFRLIHLFVLSALAIAGGCGNGDSNPAPRSRDLAISVDAVIVRPQSLQDNIYSTGTLLANEEVELRSETSGRITGVFFEEGKKVKKGDLLLKINDRDLQAQLKRKQLEEDFAADDEYRKRALYDKQAISQQEFDQVHKTLNMIKAERELIESQIAKTEIQAPFDGTIGLRYISEGSYITPGTLAATMQNINPIKVEFSVPEKYASKLTSNSKITIQTGDYQDKYNGVVYAVEAKVDPGTRTLKARATVPNPSAKLIPGLFCKVEIMLEYIPDALMIPAEAVIPELNSEKVFVCRNGQAYSVPVTVGIRTDRNVQITDGLNPNDTLIVTGLLQLTDGKKVQAKISRTE